MPVFNVTIYRETVDVITVPIEAAREDDITDKCLPDVVYESVNLVTKIKDWKVVENEIWVDGGELKKTTSRAQLILSIENGKGVFSLPPKKPYVDPRQLPIFEEGGK